MIYVTGDTHGSYRHVRAFAREHSLGPDDVIVCLGDTGFDYFGDERDDAVKTRAARAGVTFLCIRGNRDRNPATLADYRLQPWRGGEAYVDPAYPTLLLARDGSVFDLEGRSAIAIGGAYSVDKRHRLANGHLWFPDEQLTEAEKEHVEQALDRRHWRIDTVLSHTCPAAFVPQEALLPSIDQSTVDTSMEDWLQRIEQRLRYRRWYCGHFHIEKQEGRLRFLHKDIVPLGRRPSLRCAALTPAGTSPPGTVLQ